jgi:hypothetical protein
VAFGRLIWGPVLVLVTACQSDAGEICERLAECHLLPSGSTPYTEDDCTDQVEAKVPEGRRGQCLDCVTSHECGQIKTACLEPCKPAK